MNFTSNYDPRMICVVAALAVAGMCLLLAGLYLWRHRVKNVLLSLLGMFVLGLVALVLVNSKGLLIPTSMLAWFLTVVSFNTALAVLTTTLKAFFGLGQSGAHAVATPGQ